MCLGIPGKVIELYETTGLKMGKIQFAGIIREACLEYLPEVKVGDYAIVHVGFGISKVDEEEAARTYKLLEEMGQLSELADASAKQAIPQEKIGTFVSKYKKGVEDSGVK